MNEINFPVAILDKELLNTSVFKIELFELCTICGARFGIGYHGACGSSVQPQDATDELPCKLTQILTKDHRQNREHKRFIELDN